LNDPQLQTTLGADRCVTSLREAIEASIAVLGASAGSAAAVP
jgi:hypothetical protein